MMAQYAIRGNLILTEIMEHAIIYLVLRRITQELEDLIFN
jgi:hypothetical protein